MEGASSQNQNAERSGNALRLASALRGVLRGRGYAVLSRVATAKQCRQALASLHEAAWDTNGLPSHALADGTTVHDSRRQQTSASRAGWISVLTALLAQGLDREELLECTTGKKQPRYSR